MYLFTVNILLIITILDTKHKQKSNTVKIMYLCFLSQKINFLNNIFLDFMATGIYKIKWDKYKYNSFIIVSAIYLKFQAT